MKRRGYKHDAVSWSLACSHTTTVLQGKRGGAAERPNHGCPLGRCSTLNEESVIHAKGMVIEAKCPN